ncbi:phospholipid-translocating P-type ATPase [Rhizoclosmatium globosum]|uniref:Phospholipid-transporting ATPase n=1 Tax=Rhizoclosmatium globosum TaxID=329046 RepID=A0A1Y2BR39_9FUNG|nr:phospholipid-translocating P-type ATPase [Rhizoclosmatium globosum]|eukprot:ORY37212.1 phospholipid-translocating P-type ATPase [Rhizoclosmatium globosum]
MTPLTPMSKYRQLRDDEATSSPTLMRRRSTSQPEVGFESPAPSAASSVSKSRTRKVRRKASSVKLSAAALWRTVVDAFGRQKASLSPRSVSWSTPDPLAQYPQNITRNQKYNAISFLPTVLYEQFKFFFNLYFLVIALSQFIPAFKIGLLFSYIAPLAFVLLVTLGKEAADDLERMRRDTEANSALYKRVNTDIEELEYLEDGDNAFEWVKSADLQVGDLILLEKDQRVPADCILLKTSDASGTCFIRTDQLDGETDWKMRIAVPTTQRLPNLSSLVSYPASVYAEKPSKDIHTFLGTFSSATAPQKEPLTIENTLWANTVVASPGILTALILYTGPETRAVLNTSFPPQKVGLLDLEINRLSKILAIVSLLLSLLLVALDGFKGAWAVTTFRFLILFSSIIPISLRVNLDMGKTVYSRQIMADQDIKGTVVRTSTIPEELGRVGYLLTDKTGTLTRNEMELKKLHMGTMAFAGEEGMTEVRRVVREGAGGDSTAGKGRDIGVRVRDIVFALGLCHNVTPVLADDGGVEYQASSPDEVAIVKWTAQVGLSLHHRSLTHIHLHLDSIRPEPASSGWSQNVQQLISPLSSSPTHTSAPLLPKILSYKILHTFPFTSESKRMGIILRDEATHEIWFFVKGADGVMAPLVRYNDWLEEECGNMAREGLRTLVIARRRLTEDEFRSFDQIYTEALVDVTAARGDKVRNALRKIEHDLELLGLTGVEDKLQEDVKLTLELLRNAGLKIWMLTGDKIETAQCIAVSSKLVARNQGIHIISKMTDPIAALDELDLLRNRTDLALIIDGESLHTFTTHHKAAFISTALLLSVVICCRCSPTQKADMTYMIRAATTKGRVCAIGDGGNDVSMIQAADVGVGIVGKEGKQASLAADFSVTQFSYLTKLLLWHGRNSYKRSAKLGQFVFHRGLIISVMQAVFSAIFYYAPIPLYQGLLLVGYATAYTMAPVFSLVLDRDLSEDMALLYPELYKDLRKGRSLSYRTFFTWLTISVYQGGAIMLLSLMLFETEFVNIVSISFTSLIFNELLMVAFEINTWHPWMIYSEIVTVLVYIGSMWILTTDFDMAFILTWNFVWKVLVITAVSALPLYAMKLVNRKLNPPSYTKIMD